MENLYEEIGSFPFTLYDDGSIRRMYDIPGFPSGFLLDRDGKIIQRSVGWGGEESLSLWREKVEQAVEN